MMIRSFRNLAVAALLTLPLAGAPTHPVGRIRTDLGAGARLTLLRLAVSVVGSAPVAGTPVSTARRYQEIAPRRRSTPAPMRPCSPARGPATIAPSAC
jgi:hypothetical protein